MIHVAITTSYEVEHPSTAHIRSAVASIRRILPSSPIHIYCDWPQDFLRISQRRQYWKYLRRLERLQLGTLVRMGQWQGLPGLYREIVNNCRHPIILNFQHDWVLDDPDRVDVEGLCKAMLASQEVQMVRFSRQLYIRGGRRIDSQLVPVDKTKYGISLLATNGWCDHPHFATLAHYQNLVLPNMSTKRLPDGGSGVEAWVCAAYRRDIASLGFEAAHAKWGTYLYGELGQYRYIHHLGADTTNWRIGLGYWPVRKLV